MELLMLNLADKAAVYHLGLDIGYFKLSDVITWTDNIVLELDISDIPFEIYEVSLSKNKKTEDVIGILRKLTEESNSETASKILLGLFFLALEDSQKEIGEIITFMYRLAWQRDIHDGLFLELNGLESEYETAINGYGDLVLVIKDIVEFLRHYKHYGKLV